MQEIVIKIPEEIYKNKNYIDYFGCSSLTLADTIENGTVLPKGHGRLKDEDEIIKAIEDRVEFLRKNDAVFMRLRKDIDILGSIPKIRCEASTIIEVDRSEE
jgi:hypothetical protein